MRLLFSILCAAAAIVTPSLAAGQDNTLILEADGRVQQPFVRTGRVNVARIEIRHLEAGDAAALHLQCRPLPIFDNTAQPTTYDSTFPGAHDAATKTLVFQVPLGTNHQPFLFCSLMRLQNQPLTESEVKNLRATRDAATTAVTSLTAQVAASPEGLTLADATKKKHEAEQAQ